MPEQLPVPLALPRPKHLLTERRNLDDYEVYSSLNNFQNMMISTASDLWMSDIRFDRSIVLFDVHFKKAAHYFPYQWKKIRFKKKNHCNEQKCQFNFNDQILF